MMRYFERSLILLFFVYGVFVTVGGHKILKYHWNHWILRDWNELVAKHPVVEKKPLVVVIASYNNEKVCEKNLQSVFEQTYDNYRVVYIDDCSTDKTYENVKNCISKYNMNDKVTLIRNPNRRMKLPNLYRAYHECRDDEIIVALDADDWLAHEYVLEEVNRYYQNPDVWLTYGSAITHPKYTTVSGKYTYQKTLKNGTIRKSKHFDISMLRTFYASLFKQIKLKDLLYQGKFYPNTDDIATMYPMIEMAREHVLYVPEILYIINDNNPIRMRYVAGNLEEALRAHILKKTPYSALDENFSPTKARALALEEPIDLFVLSTDNPLYLRAALESYAKFLHALHSITVLYDTTSSEIELAYEKLKIDFPKCKFIKEQETPYQPLKEALLKKEKRSSPYVAITTDEMILTEPLDLLDSARKLETTSAVCLLAGHTSQNLSLIDVNDSIRAMTLASAKKIPDLLIDQFFCIFRKQDVLNTLENEKIITQSFLKTHYETVSAPDEVALFYKENKAFCLETISSRLSLSKETLLKKFEEGAKINLASFAAHKKEGLKEEDIQLPVTY